MKKIKVVHIVPMLSPGGAERVAVHILRGLNRQRYEPVVISLMGRMGCDLDRLLDEAGVEVRYLGKHLGFDYRMYSRVYRALRDCRPDIVHTHLQVLRYVFPCLVLLKRASALHTVHNLADREIEPGMRWLQRYALEHGVIPVAVAEEVAFSLVRIYGIPKCRVIPNCIPTDSYAHPKTPRSEWRAREGFRDDNVLFVCVARFAPQKNHALLLKAFAEGPAADRKAHLVLIGDGILRKSLETQAKSLGVTGQVHFLGLRSDIPEVLGAMDVFVLSSDYEGNPLSVMEAMASGLPIVSTAAGGVPDLFESGKEGLIVQPGDVQGLSNSMASLLGNREARQSLGMAAARRARENFDVSTMVEAYEELYENFVDHSHGLNGESLLRESAIPAEERVGAKIDEHSCC
jgi:glycosyltransferase involved in cell wall biosynthesis